MALAAVLAITVDPALRMMFTRMDFFSFKPKWLCWIANRSLVGTYYPEEKHPISRVLFRVYEPIVHFVLRHSKLTLGIAVALVLSTIPVYMKLGSEFMPPLNEGAFLYMPTAFPGMSVTEASRILQIQDRALKEFPEVESVFGKAGRAETSTDPAPFSMVETTVVLKPVDQWPKVERWYSSLPGMFHPLFSWATPAHRTFDELQTAMNEKLKFAGIPNIWTMPIKNRIDMLSTGIRTPVGVKVLGSDLKEIQKINEQVEAVVRSVPGTRNVFAERTADGYYLDFALNRDELARYGISIEEAQMVVASAVGGEIISNTIEGRERYSINVRYDRAFRDDINALKRVLVPTKSGMQIPMAQIADIRMVQGPSMIRNENGMLVGYVYVDIADRDIGSFVEDARKLVAEKVKLPPGYTLLWSGQFENMTRVRERLKVVLPLTLLIIALLLYFNTKSVVKTGIVLLAVPFSWVGSVWLLYLAYEERVKAGSMRTKSDLQEAIIHGAVKRIRPKMMTVMAAFMGLLPIMWASGAGSDVMRRIAAPMVGGLFTSFVLELLVYPVIFESWKWKFEMKAGNVTRR
jgi:Cu(I)/Ag(I) efflux system membrane protein CusA/SilA